MDFSGDVAVSQFVYKVNATTTIYLVDEFIDSMYVTKAWVIAGILLFYLYFSLKLGPSIMAKRKAMDIKSVIVVYNIFQLLINFTAFFTMVGNGRFLHKAIYFLCFPLDANDIMALYLCHAHRFFLSIKILDLSDTIFMVLRKRFDHITNLHLFHHTTMVGTVWFCFIYIRDPAGILAGTLNLLVHTVMYTYYLLCAMGPTTRRLVEPWKSTLTKIQIGQFLVILGMFCGMYIYNCSISPAYLWIWIINVTIILILFINFYYQAYILRRSSQESQVKEKSS